MGHDPYEMIVVRTKNGPRRVSRWKWAVIQEGEAAERKKAKKRRKGKATRQARKKQRGR